MKKFLIFMLVLGLVSTANAALTISVSTTGSLQTGGAHFDPGPTITLNISDTIWIGINSAGIPAPGHFDAVLAILGEPGPVADPDGEWSVQPNPSSNVFQQPPGPVVNGPALPPTPLTPAGASDVYWGYNAGLNSDYWVLTNSEASQVPVLAGLHADYQYHCKGVGGQDGGLVTVVIVDFWTGGVTDTLTITQVPEPMTIILLGLGGLFLRRRR